MNKTDVELTSLSGITALIYTIGIIITITLYYHVLKLQHEETYYQLYSAILIVMIAILLLNMAYSITNPPTIFEADSDILVVGRSTNIIATMIILNLMISDVDRIYTSQSTNIQTLSIIVITNLIFTYIVIWIPVTDINMMRIMRDIKTVNLTIGLGYAIIMVTYIVKRKR